MSSPVISVEHLSKAYRIGLKEEIPDTLMGAMKNVITAPWKNFKALRRLNTSTDSPLPTPQSPIPASPLPNPQSLLPNPSSPDTLWALRDVSFEINQGDVVGIIGRNGAGKSTLLKVLSRITEPTSGRVVIRGRVSSLLEVGTGFHPELTGRENVYMNGTILGMRKKEIDRKFEEIVEFSGVEKFLDTPTKRYSSGMQVRLAFAVAAHLEPEILIVDEVLAVGDSEFQKKCIGKMQDVANGGRTVLFVSHNMAAIEALCSSSIELSGGRIAATGETHSVLSHYRKRALKNVMGQNEDRFSHAKYIKKGELFDQEGSKTNTIPLGTTFHLAIRIHIASPLDNPHISLGIDTIAGERMLSLSMPPSNQCELKKEETIEISCQVDEFPLSPGEYNLKIALLNRGRLIEVVEPVVPFTVVDAELFGGGQGFTCGRCVANATWASSVLREN
ncbi:MAG TPA: polysaccharide/polyol phosphate ABC transporter ATP-binding protein [Planctomycetaceae bacterium]|nr:polysaccharide/polyol phosphate ABC transporter ATP-binding protein [Planctomycetaceae bacterium]